MTGLAAHQARIAIQKGWQEWQYAVRTVSEEFFYTGCPNGFV